MLGYSVGDACTRAHLVNNAGSSHEMPVAFAETTKEEMDTILQVVSAT